MVIVIIAILAALLLPSLTRAKRSAQGVQCMNNSRQLAIAWLMYTESRITAISSSKTRTAAAPMCPSKTTGCHRFPHLASR